MRRHFRAFGARGDEDVRFVIAPSQRMDSASSGRPPSASGPCSSSWTLAPMVRVRDANDYAVGTAALEPLVTLARETGAPVLAVHHEGKLTRDGGDGICYRLLRRRGYGPSPAAVREVPNALHDSDGLGSRHGLMDRRLLHGLGLRGEGLPDRLRPLGLVGILAGRSSRYPAGHGVEREGRLLPVVAVSLTAEAGQGRVCPSSAHQTPPGAFLGPTRGGNAQGGIEQLPCL